MFYDPKYLKFVSQIDKCLEIEFQFRLLSFNLKLKSKISQNLNSKIKMNYWLVKSEPGSYSWEDLVAKGEDVWDGVRNYQARNFLREMKKGDLVYFYHSGKEKAIIGLAEVSEEAFPDPKDADWVAVKIKEKQKLKNPITLSQIKSEDLLSDMLLIKQSRLSVMPVKKSEFDKIQKMSI